MVELTTLHLIFSLFLGFIILFLITRQDTSLICIAGVFALALVATGTLTGSISGIFNSFSYAIKELTPTILVISVIVAMSKVLEQTGIIDVMVKPFEKLMKNANVTFWVVGILMMIVSFFFWPSPAVALLGAVLLPLAIRSGLPPIGVALAMNLFGHGIALSGDFVIQGAPKITADAAGLPVSEVVSASVPLVIVMGAVTTITAFIMLKRDMKQGKIDTTPTVNAEVKKEAGLLKSWQRRLFAILIPIIFGLDIVAMFYFKLQGGDATALIGGTAVIILLVLSMLTYKKKGLEKVTESFIDGFQFGFKVFGPVIPIAAFFYLGDSGFFQILGNALPANSTGIVNDLGLALAHSMPMNSGVAAGTLTLVGAITGLDGSGFSGISLAGSVAALFSHAIGGGAAVLTALGQVSAIWIGGGTLIPWALIPVAAICNVSPFELARRNLIPVVVGLVVTTIVAMFLI